MTSWLPEEEEGEEEEEEERVGEEEWTATSAKKSAGSHRSGAGEGGGKRKAVRGDEGRGGGLSNLVTWVRVPSENDIEVGKVHLQVDLEWENHMVLSCPGCNCRLSIGRHQVVLLMCC